MSSPYPNLFKSTAWYYSRYRPAYPAELFSLIVDRFDLDGTGRLLDLGCGTGQLLIPLAPHVETAIGMDPEPEMLAEAQAAAAVAGITNAVWIQGGSFDLEHLRDQIGPLWLTTMGRAFHWMDSDPTLRALGAMTANGGGVVLCGEDGVTPAGDRDWQVAVRDVIQRWIGTERRAGSTTYAAASGEPEPWSEILERSPFPRYETLSIPYSRQLDLDGLIGFLYSTSFASPYVLGDAREGFERDLRETLLAISPEGQFEEDLRLDIYFAWKG